MTDHGELEPASEGEGSIDLLAAALRRDAADLEVYTQVLTGALADALPADAVAIERKRSMGDRMAGRPGRIERVEVSMEDQWLILSVTQGRPAAEVCRVVRGVILSRRPVPLDEWAHELAAAVTARARSDARARAALERLLLGD
ncbi:hypothetical protein [Kitasatospora sp. NBC_01266]|uniref:hypothetical protein n=1 Tax=Kitasatospora sp. NBC_01266 TaxID=2903572 RepID=UPI002E364E81|nr:hypothetical protein [Kitasatospora sp. NBC_01266]